VDKVVLETVKQNRQKVQNTSKRKSKRGWINFEGKIALQANVGV
jgi:hypothetical protein